MDARATHPPQPLPTVLHAVVGGEDVMRVAPVLAALERRGAFRQVVVLVAGDGAAWRPRDGWANALGVPPPARRLRVAAALPGRHAAAVLEGFERVVLDERPVVVVVAGDHDAAPVCALAASRHGVGVARLGSGLRSWDRSLPGEMNRVLTDQLADTLLTQSPEGRGNLEREGILHRRIHEVGNPVVDSLPRLRRAAQRGPRPPELRGLVERRYVLVSLAGRPRRDNEALAAVVEATAALARRTRVVLALPPRARAQLARSGGLARLERVGARAPAWLGRLDRLWLLDRAAAVVTDAGAVQEAASILGVRCFTLGATTDRPVTLTAGTNELLGSDPGALAAIELAPRPATPCAIPGWDGRAGERAAEVLVRGYGGARRRPAAVTRQAR